VPRFARALVRCSAVPGRRVSSRFVSNRLPATRSRRQRRVGVLRVGLSPGRSTGRVIGSGGCRARVAVALPGPRPTETSRSPGAGSRGGSAVRAGCAKQGRGRTWGPGGQGNGAGEQTAAGGIPVPSDGTTAAGQNSCDRGVAGQIAPSGYPAAVRMTSRVKPPIGRSAGPSNDPGGLRGHRAWRLAFGGSFLRLGFAFVFARVRPGPSFGRRFRCSARFPRRMSPTRALYFCQSVWL